MRRAMGHGYDFETPNFREEGLDIVTVNGEVISTGVVQWSLNSIISYHHIFYVDQPIVLLIMVHWYVFLVFATIKYLIERILWCADHKTTAHYFVVPIATGALARICNG